MRRMLLAAAACTMAAVPAFAEDWDFVLTNNAGKPIKTIELSPAGADDWQPSKVDPERRREAGVKVGGKTTVHFDKSTSCGYDVRATFEDGTTAVWLGFDVCAHSYMAVSFANGKPVFRTL